MRDVDEIIKKVEKKKQQFFKMYQNDEENCDIYKGKEQIFDSHKMAINITGTELVSLAFRVQAALMRSHLQINIFPPDKYPNPDARAVANQEERMYYYGFDKANERLDNIGEPSLLMSLAWQSVVLGRIAIRVLVYQDEDINWDYRPLNPRFLTFSFGNKDLLWANYESFRSAESIKEEYGVDISDESGISVYDYWDKEHNVRFLSKNRQLLSVWKNAIGEVPIIIRPVGIGIEGKQEGQSIFNNVKVPFRKLNLMTSIAATHAHKLAANPEVYKYPSGEEPVVEVDTIRAGGLIKIPNTHSIEGLRVPDIPSSLMMMISNLQRGIEKVTYHELNPDDSAHSGAGLRILGQDKMDVLTPRMEALNSVYQRICRMIKKQIIAQKLVVPVKTVVNNTYSIFDMVPDLLDNDFYVYAGLVRQDVYDDIEALQRAQMLMQLRLKSREDVIENVMREQDTQTQLAKMDIEDIEAMMPELKLKRAIKIYKERGMAEEAGMAEEQLGMIEFQKRAQIEQMFTQGQQGGVPTKEALPIQQGGVPPEGALPGEMPLEEALPPKEV